MFWDRGETAVPHWRCAGTEERLLSRTEGVLGQRGDCYLTVTVDQSPTTGRFLSLLDGYRGHPPPPPTPAVKAELACVLSVKPVVGENIAFHASPPVSNFAFLISA